jgi:hypothetical protein
MTKEEHIALKVQKAEEKRRGRSERRKQRKSVTRRLSGVLVAAFMQEAVKGIKIQDGDSIRVYKLHDNFDKTSTALLSSIAKAGNKIAYLAKQAEDHLDHRHGLNKVNEVINRVVNKRIAKRVRRGKLIEVSQDKISQENSK